MNKEFVPYELALKMKELRFNEPCIGWATKEYEDVIHCGNRFRVFTEDELPTKPFGVPLFQQAFKWFRDKRKYFVEIIRMTATDGKPYSARIKDLERTLYMKDCDTYEEAELDCLKELIKIVES